MKLGKFFKLGFVPLLTGSLLATNALAASNGTLGATSTGTVNISITKSMQAQISDITDMVLASWNIGDPAVQLYSNLCIYSSTGNYKVTATGSGTSNAFTISNGTSTIPYSVVWNSGPAGSLASTGTSLTTNTQSGAFANASMAAANCGGSTNDTARVVVNIPQATMQAAPGSATAYTGTLTMLVTPN